ncbi:MAG: hypothetical protein ACI8RP_001175 [Urechidicola sp.]|jgi:hypothetical protein
MNQIEADYILNYFSRLMTPNERKARKHFSGMIKLKSPKDYDSLELFNSRRNWFLEKNIITEDKDILKLLENGINEFTLTTANRILIQSPNEFCFNKCPKCDLLARTPYAKQCRNCSLDWHDEIIAEFSFKETIKIHGREQIFIIGENIKGILKIGHLIDFTNSQLNIIKEIVSLDFILRNTDGFSKEYPAMGINVSKREEYLINKYVNTSAKKIMIISQN